MANPKPEKPSFPEGASKWWHLKTSELTEEQAKIRRDYSKLYRQWRKANGPEAQKNKKWGLLPAPAWFSLPDDKLTEEQIKMKVEYRKEYYATNRERIVKYKRDYNNKLRRLYEKYKDELG